MLKIRGIPVSVFAILSILLLSSACETTEPNKDAGAVLGMIIGGLAGAAIGDSSAGSGVGAVIGAAIGGIAGAAIGAKLDEADRLIAEAAKTTALSLPTGNKVEWRSKENTSVHGFATPTTNDTNEEGNSCRTVRQVAFINGEEMEETTEFCRVGDTGRWVSS